MSDQAPDTSSSTTELKAGHAPAIKVGGMRVGAGRPRQTSQGEDKDKNPAGKEGGEETASGENEATSGNKEGQAAAGGEAAAEDDEVEDATVANRVAGQMVSGTFVPIQKAFPTEAVKHIHDKPGTHPKHEQHAYNKHDDARMVNQPRKQ